jgi:hypothetical protein
MPAAKGIILFAAMTLFLSRMRKSFRGGARVEVKGARANAV